MVKRLIIITPTAILARFRNFLGVNFQNLGLNGFKRVSEPFSKEQNYEVLRKLRIAGVLRDDFVWQWLGYWNSYS